MVRRRVASFFASCRTWYRCRRRAVGIDGEHFAFDRLSKESGSPSRSDEQELVRFAHFARYRNTFAPLQGLEWTAGPRFAPDQPDHDLRRPAHFVEGLIVIEFCRSGPVPQKESRETFIDDDRPQCFPGRSVRPEDRPRTVDSHGWRNNRTETMVT